jgi:hypothetical protein
MRLTILSLFLICLMNICQGQNVSQLEKRNGFKTIKLQMIADSIKGAKFKKEFKEKDEFPAKLYSIEDSTLTSIGEVKVDRIEVKAYNDLVYEISVVTEKDTRLMKALESLYGKAEYDIKNESYFWRTDNMVLKFKSHGRAHLELLYISLTIHKMMKTDKNQKVDDIANDF